TTIILTTHYLEEAESLCRNIAIIDAGKIAHHSDMRSLLSQLQEETFLIDVDKPLTADILNSQYTMKILDDKTLEVVVGKGQGLNEIFSGLTKKGITALSLRNKSNRLEELFLKLVEGVK
ncbi:MAG: ABC transporter ATP-binding protein, partial [Sinobacterium sp.]|nr:ABC transporter ATP-binding protein [Sinobacterium sp.]